MDDFERQWAIALKKGQMQNKQSKQADAVPLNIKKTQVKEEMDYFKEELKKYIRVKNIEKIEEILKKLFALRGEQIEIFTKEMKEDYGFINEYELEKEISKYFLDCKKLIRATQILIKK